MPQPPKSVSKRFPAQARVKRSDEFARIKTDGKRGYSKHLLISFLPRADGTSRLGLTVTKKVASSSVVRNRLKRRLRELFRTHRAEFRKAVDLVVVARQDANQLDFAALKVEFLGLLRREGVL